MLEIDGSHGEGGGQILRTAVALSAITGKPIKVNNIRSNRPNPGLQAQHLEAVKSVAKLCKARTDAKLGDTSLKFEPREIEGGHISIDIGTAGAISLVLQTLTLPAIHSEKPLSIRIVGGTHVKWSPTMDYMKNIFGYYMQKMSIDFDIQLNKYGFYPKGGGEVSVKVSPHVPRPLNLTERGQLVSSEIFSLATEDLRQAQVAERQINGAESFVKFDKKSVHYVSADCTGSSVHAHQKFENCVLGASSVGEKSLNAKTVGETAGHELKKQIDSGACVDEHMADQLLPFLAFASGPSRIRVADITDHVLTNIWVIEQFLPVKFNIDEKNKIIEVRK